jgi:hypothetical protein
MAEVKTEPKVEPTRLYSNQPQHEFQLLSPPPDKDVRAVTDRDFDKGNFLQPEWEPYTEAHLRADNKMFGTLAAVPYRKEGDFLVTKLHKWVFRPAEILHQEEDLKRRTQFAMRGKFSSSQRGHETAVRGGNKLVNSRVSQQDEED